MRKLFRSLGTGLIFIHVLGMVGSFAFFSYQYAREHGFLSWLLLGQIVPALKSSVWEAFLILALVHSPSGVAVIQSPTDVPELGHYWWADEYPQLLKMLDEEDGLLSTSYIGQQGQTTLSLMRVRNRAVILKSQNPKESIFSVDEQTGDMIPSEVEPTLIIRDHDSDGVPDDFTIEPSDYFMPFPEQALTSDGFLKIQRTQEYASISMMWSIGIGFCVNHFLHGVDSVLPP